MPWGLFRKKEADAPASVTSIGVFGKVPQMGDFVRAGGRIAPSFEAWLEAGMASGEKRHRDAWPTYYAGGATHVFAFRMPATDKDGTVLVGLLRPSRDAVGRRFPLVVFGRVPDRQFVAAPHLMPLLLESFAGAARTMMAHGEEAKAASELGTHVLAQFSLPPMETVEEPYDVWSHGTSLSVLWTMIYGDARSLSPLYALKSIHEVLGPSPARENTSTPLGLRLPIGDGGLAAAAFWLDLVRRILRGWSTVPTCFWAIQGHASALMIQLGTTPPSSLADLWCRDPDSPSMCDLTTAPALEDRNSLLRALPKDVARGFERVRTASDLLELVSR
jgi:type VI secretion system ImpM family protein